jgi:hypothetical protein
MFLNSHIFYTILEKDSFNKTTIKIKICVHGCALRKLPVPDQVQLQINVSIVENKENI